MKWGRWSGACMDAPLGGRQIYGWLYSADQERGGGGLFAGRLTVSLEVLAGVLNSQIVPKKSLEYAAESLFIQLNDW